MYGWFWRHLPGPWVIKSIICAVLIAGACWLCFKYFFPWVSPYMPFNNSQVG